MLISVARENNTRNTKKRDNSFCRSQRLLCNFASSRNTSISWESHVHVHCSLFSDLSSIDFVPHLHYRSWFMGFSIVSFLMRTIAPVPTSICTIVSVWSLREFVCETRRNKMTEFASDELMLDRSPYFFYLAARQSIYILNEKAIKIRKIILESRWAWVWSYISSKYDSAFNAVAMRRWTRNCLR